MNPCRCGYLGDAVGRECSRAPRCGDGIAQAGEGCDDGNGSENDACLTTCRANTCGDGFLHLASEECDDGNADNDDQAGPKGIFCVVHGPRDSTTSEGRPTGEVWLVGRGWSLTPTGSTYRA